MSGILSTRQATTADLLFFLGDVSIIRGGVCVLFCRPFRRVTDKGALLWDRIHRLEKGKIYKQVLCQQTPTTHLDTDKFRTKSMFAHWFKYIFLLVFAHHREIFTSS